MQDHGVGETEWLVPQRIKRKNCDQYSAEMTSVLIPPSREGDSIRSVFGMYCGVSPDASGS